MTEEIIRKYNIPGIGGAEICYDSDREIEEQYCIKMGGGKRYRATENEARGTLAVYADALLGEKKFKLERRLRKIISSISKINPEIP